MNRFKDTLDELRQRPAGKQAKDLMPDVPVVADPLAPPAPDEGNGQFKLPYSSDPEPIVEQWK